MRDFEKILLNMAPELKCYYLRYIDRIKDAILDFFPSKFDKAFYERVTGQVQVFDTDEDARSETILLPTHEYLERGGKALRPVLVALCLEAYGKDPAPFMPFIGAIEVMESSSIMMDDYIDNSMMRRGGPCAHVAYGYAVANISSCTAYALSHYGIFNNELALPVDKAARLLNAFAWEHIQMAFGQMEELYWTESNVNSVTVRQYLQETIARCAFLSFRGPLKYAGMLADAPEEDIPVLEKMGDYLLIGYHIRGDNLDMSPDSQEWGKVAGEDISTGRRTLLINYVLQHATESDRETLTDILNARSRDEKKKRLVYEMVLKYNAFEYTRHLAEEYNARAQSEIEKLHVPKEYKTLFREFSDFSSERRMA